MCRLLVVKSKNEFSISNHLKEFAEICRDSEEYQGHGWGLAYLNSNNDWIHYKNIKPIFEDDLTQFSKTKFLVVHARSAFQDKDIIVIESKRSGGESIREEFWKYTLDQDNINLIQLENILDFSDWDSL